jgi:uncharacterized membrane protein YccF (DUF307 family)
VIRDRKILRVLGYSALLLFAFMAVVLQIWVAPHVDFLPQAQPQSYSDRALMTFAQDLDAASRVGLYKAVVLLADTLFILTFGLWVCVAHILCSTAPWRWIGLGLAPAFMALDFVENTMLVTRIHLATQGDLAPMTLLAEVSLVHYITILKYTAFALCLISSFMATRRTA